MEDTKSRYPPLNFSKKTWPFVKPEPITGQSIAFVSMLRNSEPATVSTMSPSMLPYSRPSPRLPLHHFSQRRMLASLRRREARRSQGDLEALARGQRFFSLHQFTICCCMLFTTLRCQPPPHSHLERPIINPIFDHCG